MKFEINDLAHINHAKFNDDKDITVIVGDNGSGKTILLETLLLVKKKKKELITKLLSNDLKLGNEIERISFDSSADSLTDFLLELELKNHTQTSRDLESIEKEASFSFEDDKAFFWNGNVEFTLKNTKELENLINTELKKLQSLLPEMISKEILFNNEEEARFKITDEKISIDKKYEININFTTARNNQIWHIKWKNAKDVDRVEYEFLRKRFKPVEVFRSVLTKILYEYIFDQSLGFSTDSQILMVPTERSQLMLSTNEDFKNLFEKQSNKMRYSESSFLTDYFLNKDEIFFITTHLMSKSLKNMIGGEIEHDSDGNIIGIIEKSGELIDWRLFSTKQNRVIPYLFIESKTKANELQLIIEEPEANLSLKSIREIVDYIIELVTSSSYPVKVILTTHSDVFFQILNLKLLKNKSISSRVYEFQKKKERNVLVECLPDEYGYSTDLFGKELEKLFNETQQLEHDIDDDDSNNILFSNLNKGNDL